MRVKDQFLKVRIFTNVPEIANRISGVAFLPVFDLLESYKGETGIEFNPLSTPLGTAFFYDFISPKEVYEHTLFSLSFFSTLSFLRYNKSNPIRSFSNNILRLNVSLEGDLNILQFEYNVQYFITGNENVLLVARNYTLV